MFEVLQKFAPVIAVSGFSAIGTLLLKSNADNPNETALFAGLISYMAANYYWIIVLRDSDLGWSVVVCSMLTTVLLVLYGTFSGTPLDALRLTGLLCAILAMTFFGLSK
ncbi:MAG: hypothetical protein JKY31_04250 [Rhodobacteraceae bacterium]|nr:hypothetical protein [Paracoccaceae bacterium]